MAQKKKSTPDIPDQEADFDNIPDSLKRPYKLRYKTPDRLEDYIKVGELLKVILKDSEVLTREIKYNNVSASALISIPRRYKGCCCTIIVWKNQRDYDGYL